MKFDPRTSEAVRSRGAETTSPLVAIGWLAFTVLLLISPAMVWAGWRWLL